MSTPELTAEVRRWLRLASEDLSGAEWLLANAAFVPRYVCWLAQQATEKARNAIHLIEGLTFPFGMT